MPIKRAKSKNKSPLDDIWGGLFFDIGGRNDKVKAQLRKSREKIEVAIEIALRKIHKKKRLSEDHVLFWDTSIEYLSKDLISKIINQRSIHWEQSLYKACLKKHQDNNYIKRR